MRILTFLAGAATGYVLGTRAGRGSYDKMMTKAQQLWDDPRTQQRIDAMGDSLKTKSPAVGEAVESAVSTVSRRLHEPQ